VATVNKPADGQDENYFTLARGLAAFLDQLPNRPTYRQLAGAADVSSQSTIHGWLRRERFPQQVDQILRVVRQVRSTVRASGADMQDLAGLLDEGRWRDAYRREAARRSASTGDTMRAAQGREALSRHPDLASSADYQAMARLRAALPAPYPPNEFVARPDVQQWALDLLLQEPPARRGRVIALAGMSGAGKTVLAQSIASDARVRERFPGGVLWIELDRDSPSTFWRDEMLRALGENIPANSRAASALLQTRIAGQRCLIVLDDVSIAEQIEPVNVVGPDSALLVTTQDETVLAGMEICRVEECQPDTSRQLLEKYSEQDAPGLPSEADKILQDCGGLALAIAICGAMFRAGDRWADIADSLDRAAFNQLKTRFAGYEKPSLLAALEVGVSRLPDDDQDLYSALAVFDRRGLVPVTAAHMIWSSRGLDLHEARRKIAHFARRSLLTYQADEGVFRLHDLLSQYAVSRAGAGLPALHHELADAYLRSWGGIGEGLPEVPRGDDYGVAHLSYHLDMAGQEDLLHRVLAAERLTYLGSMENSWYTVHDQAGQIAQFMSDLRLACTRAEQATDRSRTAEERARNRALEMRYALAKSSILGIAASVPPPLLAALVKHGVWSFAKAWAYSGTLPAPTARAHALAVLARLPADFGIDRDLLLASAKVAAEAIEALQPRAWALARLIPCTPDPDRPALFEAAIQATGAGRSSRLRAWILVRLAPHVPELVRSRLADIRDGLHGAELAEALLLVVPHVPDALGDLSTAVHDLRRAAAQPITIAKALSLVPEPDKAQLIAYACESVSGSQKDPRVPSGEQGVKSLVDALLHMQGRGNLRARMLIALLPLAPEADRRTLADAAIAAIREVASKIRNETLEAVFPHISDSERTMLIDEIVRPAAEIRTLCAIAQYLPPQLLAVAVEQACALTTEFRRTQAFQALAPCMPPALLSQALQALLSLDTPEDRGHALSRLVSRVSPAHQAAALTVITGAQIPDERAKLLSKVARHIPTSLIQAAANAIPLDANPDYRAAVLAQLAGRSEGVDRASLLAEAIEAACSSPERTNPLRDLPRLAGDPWQLSNVILLRYVLEGNLNVSEIADPGDLEKNIRTEVLSRAVQIARELTDQCRRSRALAGLVACTSGELRAELLREALDSACALHHHFDLIRCDIQLRLREAVRYVPEHERQVLPPDYLAEVEARIAASAPGPRQDGLDHDEDHRVRQLICVLTYLPASQRERIADQTLHEIEHGGHERDRIKSIITLAPLLAADHSDELVRLTERLSDATDRIEPLVEIARYAPETERAAILDRAMATDSDQAGSRSSRVLIMIAPHLPESRRLVVIEEALAHIAMSEGSALAAEIADLAPHLPATLLDRASDIADKIGEAKERASARRALALAGNSADPQHWRFWRSALADAAAVDRSTLLSLTVDACLAVGGDVPNGETEPTADHLAEAILATFRWWPGGSRSAKTGIAAFTDQIFTFFDEFRIDVSEQEVWMSDWPHHHDIDDFPDPAPRQG
jgi:hypothetical protein